MKTDKMISVIVPIYNVEKYIEKCLFSIMQQTYKNIEVLLIDDGSTDQSGKIAKKFSEQDTRYIYIHKENGGLSSARNEGLNRAKGDFVYFLDSDDWIAEKYLEQLVDAFDELTDVIIGKYKLDDETIGKVYVPFAEERIERSFVEREKEKEIVERHINAYPRKDYLLKDTLMPVWKNMYRRKFQ